ncbi:transmembrane protein 104-like [Oscarella lobularis]|uniref:transmembrane protein 104-like n=1 Tax=Oscarella lobularis TaxID=121494 RepID=UPI0033142518
MRSLTETGAPYSRPVAFVYIFNLIIGTGILAIPNAFKDAGWAAAMILLIILGFLSYLTATLVVEAMACMNALEHDGEDIQKLINTNSENDTIGESLTDKYPVTGSINKEYSLFEITERYELGTIAGMFFNKIGIILYYICMVVYLYGDLAIYAVAMGKAMTNVICVDKTYPANSTNVTFHNGSHNDSHFHHNESTCFGTSSISSNQTYRIFLAVFTFVLGPFVFFNVQKTKYLQIMTSVLRYTAFGMAIVISFMRITRGEGAPQPPAIHPKTFPILFGVLVYAFMCQHSLPSIVTPIRTKRRLPVLLLLSFICVFVFYALVSFSIVFAFDPGLIKDEFTNTFTVDVAGPFPSYFLRLFPVFVLTTNFPIIAVTLRNNLKTLFYRPGKAYPFVVDRIVFPLLALLPPICIALITEDLTLLVGVTGAYAGVGVQYVIPAALVWQGRKRVAHMTSETNVHRSPFRHVGWLYLLGVWSFVSWVFVTVYIVLKYTGHDK